MPDRSATRLLRSAGGLFLLSTMISTPADAAQLIPHRAVYEMRLDTATTSSGISDLTGRMVFEFRGSSCDGYTQNMRLVTRVTDQSGGQSVSDLRTSSFEESDGKTFRFNATTLRNSRVREEASGKANVEHDNTLNIELTKPKKENIAVREPVLFPVQHSLALLSAAQSGQRILQANIYDGSDQGKKYFATTTVVGNRVAPGTGKSLDRVDAARALDEVASWPVSVSYYESVSDHDDGVPTYQMTFRFFENGVARDLKIDYGKFSVNGKLADIEFYETANCQ